MITPGLQTGLTILNGFAAYLAQGFGGPALASVPHLPWRVARGEAPMPGRRDLGETIGVTWLDLGSARDTEHRLEQVREGLERMPATLLATHAPHGVQVLTSLVERHAIRPTWVGQTPGADPATLAIVERRPHLDTRPPAGFRVLAIVPAFNEADIIDSTLAYLIAEGVEVYLLDNWSTDATLQRASQWLGRGLVHIERFPRAGPSNTYDLQRLLGRVEEIALEQPADWYVLHDADERRRSPWPDLGLRDALWRVDRRGFNCIDHVTLNFWPTDDGFDEHADVEDQLRYYEFSSHPGHFHQRRTWKNRGVRVALGPTAGHDVAFPGRRVEPFKFLLKHFPIRSQAHGERKVLRERMPRFLQQERAAGWHAQYDELDATRFVRKPTELRYFDASTFYSALLIERLSGLGIVQHPPAWATALQ